jgi:hypothetical protein
VRTPAITYLRNICINTLHKEIVSLPTTTTTAAAAAATTTTKTSSSSSSSSSLSFFVGHAHA